MLELCCTRVRGGAAAMNASIDSAATACEADAAAELSRERVRRCRAAGGAGSVGFATLALWNNRENKIATEFQKLFCVSFIRRCAPVRHCILCGCGVGTQANGVVA